jgi:hypothetical protein
MLYEAGPAGWPEIVLMNEMVESLRVRPKRGEGCRDREGHIENP